MIKKIIFLLIITTLYSFSQDKDVFGYYDDVDSTIYENKYLNYVEIIKFIKNEYPHNQLYQSRAVSIWICENMMYQVDLFNYDSQLNIKTILKLKKGSCNAYAFLLKSMCDSLGIDCIKVDGLVKISGYVNITGHSWNVLCINGKNVIIDITWMNSADNSSYYNNSWFDVDPEYFIYSHYPFKYDFNSLIDDDIKLNLNTLLRTDKYIIKGSYDVSSYQCLEKPITLEYFLAIANYIKYDKDTYKPLRPYPIKKFWYINK